MLRQIHVFHKSKLIPIFSYSYAMALGDNEIQTLVTLIKSHIEMPQPRKTFQKPMANFQVFHRSSAEYTFIFIVDLVDHLEQVDDALKATIVQFEGLFKYPEEIEDSEGKKNQFIEFIEPIQRDFHSKITIVGPINSGKTMLYDLLKEGEEKKIMNFAKVSNYSIDKLSFDIWDFQLRDNFSLLWSKFFSGSDLIILIFDLSDYHLRVVEHFKSIINHDAQLSKVLIFGNKRDLIDESDLKFVRNELEMDNFIEISLKDTNAKQKVDKIISDELKLKKSLPDEYYSILNDAKELEQKSNLVLAIVKYKELIKLCDKCQNLNLTQQYKTKVENLQSKIDEKTQLRKLQDRKRKFEIPGKIQFDKKIEVKPLPSDGDKKAVKSKVKSFQSFGSLEDAPKEEKKELAGDLTLFDKSEVKKEKRFLTPSDVKIDLKKPKARKSEKKPLIIEEKLESTAEKDVFPEDLKHLIEEKGSSLSLDLCKQLISELEKTLSRPLKMEDLEMAANIFVKNDLKN